MPEGEGEGLCDAMGDLGVQPAATIVTSTKNPATRPVTHPSVPMEAGKKPHVVGVESSIPPIGLERALRYLLVSDTDEEDPGIQEVPNHDHD